MDYTHWLSLVKYPKSLYVLTLVKNTISFSRIISDMANFKCAAWESLWNHHHNKSKQRYADDRSVFHVSVRFWQHHWLRLSKPDSHSLIGWDPTCQSAFYIVSYIGCPKSNTHIEYFDWSFVLWRCPEETNPWVIHISPNRDYNRRKAVRIIINQLKMVWSLSLYLQGTFFFFLKGGGWLLWECHTDDEVHKDLRMIIGS